MKQNINQTDLHNIIRKVIKESTDEKRYISIMVPRIKSWMDEVYQDWGGINAVSPEALTDFSNRNDYDDALDTYANEFNMDKEQLRPLFDKALQIAHNELKQGMIGEGVVDKFTPYTNSEKAKNFEYLLTGCGRTPEERNPAYAKALKAAEERRKQKQAQKSNESIEETQHIGAERASANNVYANTWFNKYAKPLCKMADKAIEHGDVAKMTHAYNKLITLYKSNPIQYDARLISARERIKAKYNELVDAVQNKMLNRNESIINNAVKDIIKEWKKSINEDSYSYNGLDRQAEYDNMGKELLDKENRQKYYKKNIALFKKAYNKVYKEFTIIPTLKRKSEEAKNIFDGENYLKFVEHTEGETLYTPIWEKYGGEYLEMANAYLESYIVKLRRKLNV